jgi:hypothetical protein
MAMRKLLDDFNLAPFSLTYFAAAVFALESEPDAITTSLVNSTMHAMAEKSALCERKYLRFVVINVRRASARPV